MFKLTFKFTLTFIFAFLLEVINWVRSSYARKMKFGMLLTQN